MYIQNNENQYPCKRTAMLTESMHFECVGLPEAMAGQIKLCADNDFVLATYNTADYLRTVIEGGRLTLTNIPAPSPPTVDELRTAALQRIDGKCSAAIYAGFDLNGKHYTATQNDQGAIKDALLAFELGKTSYPYAAVGEMRSPHTKEQIAEIADKMSACGIVHTGYYACLKAWIARETDAAVFNAIDYGAALPDDLMQALGADVSQYGIDLNDYAGMLN